MRTIVFVLVMILGIGVGTIVAQDAPEGFDPFTNEQFGVQGILPTGWASPTAGFYQRGDSAMDTTAVIVQSAAIPLADLSAALTAQFGLETLPDAIDDVTTDFGTWMIYRVDNEEFEVSISLALTEQDGTSYLVILQSPMDEHDTLVPGVFDVVVENVRLLEASDDIDETPSDAPYTEDDVTFMNGETTLAGTLTIPNNGDTFPVVVIVSGSGAQDRTGSLAPVAEIDAYTQIADYLARQGIAVLRYDDRGVGESTTDTMNPTLEDFRDDANAAINFLAERDEFTHIGIAGHSEGGAYAPEIALTNEAVDFVIGLNAPTVSIIEIALYQQIASGRALNVPEETLQAVEEAYRAVIDVVVSDDEDALRAAVAELVRAQTGEVQPDSVVDAGVAQFQSAIVQSYISYDPTPFWLELDVPTLAIFGSLDLQVVVEQSVPVIEGENENLEIVVIENMNHIFQQAETGTVQEYSTLEQVVMPDLLETLADWILETTAD